MKIKYAPLGQLGANFYMVTDEATNEMFVVDPGDCADIIIELINNTDATLKYIILTHAHTDHIGALDEVKKAFDVPIVIHREEADRLNDGDSNLCPVFAQKSPSAKADICVADGDTLNVGKSIIRFLHTPGHTPGSMCILFDDKLISGDTIFYSSVGRTDFPGGSFESLCNSIKDKIYTLNPDTIIYPGHGETTTVGYEIMYNPFIKGN